MSDTDQFDKIVNIFNFNVAPSLALWKIELNDMVDTFLELNVTDELPQRDQFIGVIRLHRDKTIDFFQDGYDQALELAKPMTELEAERFSCYLLKELTKLFEKEKKQISDFLAAMEVKLSLFKGAGTFGSDNTPTIH